MWKRAIMLPVFYISMALFGIGALTLNALCWLLCFLPRCRGLERFARVSIHLLMRLWMNYLNLVGVIVITWPEIRALRRMRGIVIVANHPNLLDICWILAASSRVTCFMKSGIRRNNFFAASAALAGYISNDSGMDGLHEAVDRLEDGDILSVFPEGTRTTTPPMNHPIKPGFALIARQAGAPIQTLFIRSSTRCFTKGVFFRPGPLPIRFDLRFGPMLHPAPERPARETADAVEHAMRASLESPHLWH